MSENKIVTQPQPFFHEFPIGKVRFLIINGLVTSRTNMVIKQPVKAEF